MREDGFDHGEGGLRQFAEAYGVLEKVTTIETSENSCSKAKVSTTVKRRPGASPLLFGKYLMNMAAFVSLEDISDALPPYTEEVLSVDMDPELKKAYSDLENDIRDALREHHGNASVISTAMNALLLYPDRPFRLGTLYGFCTNPDSGERERFIIADPPDLDEQFTYAKERRLIEEVRQELARGSKVQVFAVYTQKRDVTRRLQSLLCKEGIRAEVLTAATPPEQREAWYERQLRSGMQVCICHPKLVQTGLDYVEYEARAGLTLSLETSPSHGSARCPLESCETERSGAARSRRISRQGMRISRVGADVDPLLRAGYFPAPNQAFIVGEYRAFAGGQFFNEDGCLGLRRRETPNLIEVPMIIEHIREDHGVPDSEGHLQRFPGSVFTRLAREVVNYGRCEVQERLGDFSIGIPNRAFKHLALSALNLYSRPINRSG